MAYRYKEPSTVKVVDEASGKLIFKRFDSFGKKSELITYAKTYVRRFGYRGMFSLSIVQDGGFYESRNIKV